MEQIEFAFTKSSITDLQASWSLWLCKFHIRNNELKKIGKMHKALNFVAPPERPEGSIVKNPDILERP